MAREAYDSKDGGISTFRSSVVVAKDAKGSKSAVSCQSLMLDSESRSDTIPAMDIRTKSIELFINDGQQVATTAVCTPLEAEGIRFFSDKKMYITVEKYDIVL